MQKLLLTAVFGLTLFVGPVGVASAYTGDDLMQAGHGDRLERQRLRHRPRRHRQHRGKRIETVPELSVGSAAIAMILVLGGAVVVDERRRLRVVTLQA